MIYTWTSSRKALKWRVAALVLWAIVLTSPVPVFADQKAVVRDRQAADSGSVLEKHEGKGELYALVVGVSKYASQGIPTLRLPVKDAKDFAAFVKSQEQLFNKVHVTELLDENATRANIETYLLYEVRNAGKDDAVILYFSGHGSIDQMRAGEFYFLSYDADPAKPAATAVHMNRDRFFNSLPAGKLLVVMDACHSGTEAMHKGFRTRSTGESMNNVIQQFKESTGQVMITSSMPNEYSMEFPDLPNGVFTYFLLEGLKGKAHKDQDGVVTARAAYDYAYEQTKKRSKGAQHPVWSGNTAGPFPLSYVRPRVIELTTEPPEVSVSIKHKTGGFKALGKTNTKGRLRIRDLPGGEQLFFRLSKPGWQEEVLEPIVLGPDQWELKTPVFKLTPRRAHLTIRTNSAGVRVSLDNNDVGETDESNFLFVENVQVGVPHDVTLKKEGFQEKKVSMTIPLSHENSVYKWQENLVPVVEAKPQVQLVEVSVSTQPADVAVYAEGTDTPLGRTDAAGRLKFQLKGPGTVALHFRKNGHATETREVSLPARGSLVVGKVTLESAEPTLRLYVDQPAAKVFVKGKGKQDKAIKREDAELGYEYVGETDASGHITVKGLPIGPSIWVKIKKAGWQEKIEGPFVFSEDKLNIAHSKIMLASAHPKPDPADIERQQEARRPDRVTSTDLVVNTRPGDVGITIDGEYKGDTDKNGELRVKGLAVDKPLKVVFKKYGHMALEKSIKLAAVASTRMDTVVLNRLMTRLEFVVNAPFADIMVKSTGDFEAVAKSDSIGNVVVEDLPLDKAVRLKISKEGWRDKSLSPITFSEQKTHIKLPDVKLEPAIARVWIPTDPGGVKVKIDGNEKKVTGGSAITLTDIQVAVGHEIEISKEGFQTRHIALNVPPDHEGKTYRMDTVKLDRVYARVELRTDRPAVSVKLDGTTVGQTDKDGNVLLERIPVGVAHSIQFEKEGYRSKSITVTVPPEYEGGVYRRPEMVYLDADQRKTDTVVSKPTPERTRQERSAPEPSSYRDREPRHHTPSDFGGTRDTSAPVRSGFPSDFTN